jgi:hypothetical protein
MDLGSYRFNEQRQRDPDPHQLADGDLRRALAAEVLDLATGHATTLAGDALATSLITPPGAGRYGSRTSSAAHRAGRAGASEGGGAAAAG